MNTPLSFRRLGRASLAFLILAALAPLLRAAESAPHVKVEMPSEGESLAKGFERAFRHFGGGPLFLTYEKEGSALRTLAGIRSLEAEGAVLIVVTDRGTTIAIPARRVLALTDERPQ